MKKVLVADDDPSIRRLIEVTLSDQFEITMASDGDEALAILAGDADFACVILDVTMPNKGGLEVVEAMKSEEALKDLPVVILTAHESATLYRDLMRKGVTVYFYKPFERKKLRTLICNITGVEETVRGGRG